MTTCCSPCLFLGGGRHPSRVRTDFVAVHASNPQVLQKLPSNLPFLIPAAQRHSKIIYLVRHAEAEHNVQEKRAQDEARLAGGQEAEVEAARKSVLHNPAFRDASLSSAGETQVASAAAQFSELLSRTHYPAPEIVFASPLQRALQTASILFPGHRNVHAMEFLREKRTGMPCDERSEVSVIRKDFPHIDLSDVDQVDKQSCDGYVFRKELVEDNEAVSLRGSYLLSFIRCQPSESIAIVTHKGFLREFNKGALTGSGVDLEGGHLPAIFGNAEVRVCEVTWCTDGQIEVKARSLQDATVRPPMVVEEMPMSSQTSLAGCGSMSVSATTSGFINRVRRRLMPVTTPPEADGLQVATGASNHTDAAEAAEAAWRSMQERLGGAPTFALAFCQCDVDRSQVARVLRRAAGACNVVGGSSMLGVLTRHGFSKVGVVGFRDLVWRCGVGAVPDVNVPTARKASREATQMATNGQIPDLVLLFTAPGREEDVLEGIRDVCGDVPIFGGSSANDSVMGRSCGSWWQLYGTMAGWGTHTDGIVVAALWLFQNVDAFSLLSHSFAPTEYNGTITKAVGRTLSEIDNAPAAQVLNTWTGGALGSKSTGGTILREMALFPLAIVHQEVVRLVHSKEVLVGGKVECFGNVSCGPVKLMHLKASDLVGGLAAVARSALDRSPGARGAIIDICAGAVSSLEDPKVLLDALPKELPEYLCFFSFGEQGMIDGNACHGNLMVNIVLFS